MPTSVVLTREEFVQWLAGSYLPRSSSGYHREFGVGDIMLVWRDTAGPPDFANPAIIAVPRDAIRDFFAFTATYVGTYVPFSAFFRVITVESLREVESQAHRPNLATIHEEFVAVAIAEAYLQSGGAQPVQDISIQAGLATLSGVMIAGLARGYDRDRLQRIPLYWRKARNAFNSESLKIDPDQLAGFWDPVLDILLNPDSRRTLDGSLRPIANFVRSQLANGLGIDSSVWRGLIEILPNAMHSLMQEGLVSREDQVKNLDYATKVLIESEGVAPLLREVVAGFALARVSGGSLSHLDLCSPFFDKLPRAVLWYALFAGCWKGNTVLSDAECLGRRLSRQLFTWSDIFSAPSSDISYLELNSLLERDIRPRFRTLQQTVTSVELLPGVNARIRTRPDIISKREGAVSSSDKQALQDLRGALRSAISLIDKLGGDQASFFGNLGLRRDKKNAKRS
jgi:hypothetical protein